MPKKEVKQPVIADFFRPEELKPLTGEHLEGQVLVLRPNVLNDASRCRENMLWEAHGGFGCNPDAIGQAVISTCLSDGERTRWNRAHFGAIYVGKLPEKAANK